jgi:hypothetical protein
MFSYDNKWFDGGEYKPFQIDRRLTSGQWKVPLSDTLAIFEGYAVISLVW